MTEREDAGAIRGEVPSKLGLDIVRALRPTAITALREVTVRRVRRLPAFNDAPADERARLERAILAGDEPQARGALAAILGADAARVLLDQDPRQETPPVASLAPVAERPWADSRRLAQTPPRAPAAARGLERLSARFVDHETVLSIGRSVAGRERHERPHGDIQRWVADVAWTPSTLSRQAAGIGRFGSVFQVPATCAGVL